VALLAGLTAVFAASGVSDVSALAARQRTELTSAIAVAAGAAWDRNNSWASADLTPILDLAARTGADVRMCDQAGDTVASSPGFAKEAGPQSSAPVVVSGQQIGMAVARSSGSGLTATDYVLLTARELLPGRTEQVELLSVRQHGSYLFLRYRMRRTPHRVEPDDA
jgi:hypothetical protein